MNLNFSNFYSIIMPINPPGQIRTIENNRFLNLTWQPFYQKNTFVFFDEGDLYKTES